MRNARRTAHCSAPTSQAGTNDLIDGFTEDSPIFADAKTGST